MKRKASTRTAKRSSPRYSSLSAREKATYDKTTNVISDLRRGEGSYTELLRKHHLASVTARKYGGRDLIGGTQGKPVRASRADRRVRVLMFPKAVGDVPFRTRSSRDATRISEYFHDRANLLRGKLSSEDFETKWRAVIIDGQQVFADAAEILHRAEAGDLDHLERLYASTGGAQ